MKKWILWATVASTVACSNKEGTTLTVKLENDTEVSGLVVLYELQEMSLAPVDTLVAEDEGEYTTTLPKGQEKFYRVDIMRKHTTNLVLDGSEGNVTVEITDGDVTVSGSSRSETVQAIDKLLAENQGKVQEMNQAAMVANSQGDEAGLQALIDQYNAQQQAQLAELKALTRQALPSIAALYALNFVDMESNFDFYDSAVNVVAQSQPDHFWVSGLQETLETTRKLAVGQPAPDFTLNTPEGEPLSLSDLRGKYVLIDFWAAWCRPCRVENPNVVRMYNQYGGGTNFEILGVSLDRTREAWLKAIEDDNLLWVHVSDLQYFNSKAAQMYNIQAIPATYLIDDQGRIVAKNLRGPSLEAKLQELFGAK